MERRVHPNSAVRLFVQCLALFAEAMGSLILGMWAESKSLPSLRAIGYCGFLGFAACMPLSVWWQCRSSRCPACQRLLAPDAERDQEESLLLACHECEIEWNAQGVVCFFDDRS